MGNGKEGARVLRCRQGKEPNERTSRALPNPIHEYRQSAVRHVQQSDQIAGKRCKVAEDCSGVQAGHPYGHRQSICRADREANPKAVAHFYRHRARNAHQ